jgi:hypothetical protein
MKIKTRVKNQCFIDGNAPVGKATVTASFIVEVCVNRKWTPLGDTAGITRYGTREAAQKVADKVGTQEVVVG